MERMINRRLVWYLESHELLTNVQYGFRSRRSTIDHLLRFETFCKEVFVCNQHRVWLFLFLFCLFFVVFCCFLSVWYHKRHTWLWPTRLTSIFYFTFYVNTICLTPYSRWCDGSSDRSFMVDPLSYFSFSRGMCYPVYGMIHIKESLLLIGKSSPCGGNWFPLSLFEWSFTKCMTPYNRK